MLANLPQTDVARAIGNLEGTLALALKNHGRELTSIRDEQRRTNASLQATQITLAGQASTLANFAEHGCARGSRNQRRIEGLERKQASKGRGSAAVGGGIVAAALGALRILGHLWPADMWPRGGP